MTEKLLHSIYYNPKNSASFSSAERLYEAVKDKGVSLDEVKSWLSSQITYTLHKSSRKNFKRNKILVNHIDEQWEADLVDMQEFSSKNDRHNYILTVIDCFSKFAFVRPIRVKTGLEITNAFKSIFLIRRPSKIRTDKGKEFVNKIFQ